MGFLRARPIGAFLRGLFALLVLSSIFPWDAAFTQQSAPFNTSKAPVPKIEALDPGSVKSGVYRNGSLGFSCKIPATWVPRTDEMNAPGDEQQAPANQDSKISDKAGRVLLAVFSRPPEAHGEEINSSIVIAAEPVAAYPGLKDAAQYFGPITEIARAQGFEVDEEPYEFAVGTKTLVRSDFEKDVGSRVMHQSTLVMLARGYAVSFTFIGGTEDDVEERIGNLTFAQGSAKH
jgi:hypothetical protein